jgi:hypothetical protein
LKEEQEKKIREKEEYEELRFILNQEELESKER